MSEDVYDVTAVRVLAAETEYPYTNLLAQSRVATLLDYFGRAAKAQVDHSSNDDKAKQDHTNC